MHRVKSNVGGIAREDFKPGRFFGRYKRDAGTYRTLWKADYTVTWFSKV